MGAAGLQPQGTGLWDGNAGPGGGEGRGVSAPGTRSGGRPGCRGPGDKVRRSALCGSAGACLPEQALAPAVDSSRKNAMNRFGGLPREG